MRREGRDIFEFCPLVYDTNGFKALISCLVSGMIGAAHISAGRGGAGRGQNVQTDRQNEQACSRNGGGPCHPEVQSPSP